MNAVKLDKYLPEQVTAFVICVAYYFKIKRCREWLLNVITAAAISGIVVAGSVWLKIGIDQKALLGDSIGVLGVILGFMIAGIALVTASDSVTIRALKQSKKHKVVFGKDMTLYDELLAEMVWDIDVTGTSLLVILVSNSIACNSVWLVATCLFLSAYSVVLAISVVHDLFFVFTAKM